MVETKDLLEGEFVNVELVKNSPTKKLVILTEGEIKDSGKFGTKLTLDVEMDGKRKRWSLNKPTMESFKPFWGTDSKNWVGKSVQLMVTEMDGKVMILGSPYSPAPAAAQ